MHAVSIKEQCNIMYSFSFPVCLTNNRKIENWTIDNQIERESEKIGNRNRNEKSESNHPYYDLFSLFSLVQWCNQIKSWFDWITNFKTMWFDLISFGGIRKLAWFDLIWFENVCDLIWKNPNHFKSCE